ncbi:hypothetical protein J1786_02520 [Rahnella sp. L72c]|uniref:Transposase n=1 Tax=Rahnella perminowiae TaxID=2816244 RepID=A0ABS6KVR4_9GAMM|nr:hypothetical protein [Rahnella perminowiae]MBU9833706.1 hypothetical protein [Rahnella perminowiae]
MRKIRFTEHQIIAVLKSVEAGRTVKGGRGSAQLTGLRVCTLGRSATGWEPEGVMLCG